MSDSERFLREHSAMVEANERLRAELAEARAILAAVDELGRGMSIGLSRATRECDALRAELAEARENEVFCNGCSGGEWTWMRRADEAEAAIVRVRELLRGRWVSVDALQSALDGELL